MKKSNIKPLLIAGLSALILQGCFVAKDYERPEVVDEALFRTENLPQDSLNMADVPWQDLFADPTLKGHIAEGLANNMDIRIALQRMAAAQAYFKQGKAGNLPTFTAQTQVTHQELSRNSQFGAFFDGGITQYELSGTLSWEADIWGKIRSNRRGAEAAYLQTAAAHQAVKSALVANIATAYFQLLMLDEQLAVVEATLDNRHNSLETIQALKEAGLVTEVAVQQTAAQLENAKAIRLDLLKDIVWIENSFSLLLGTAPHKITRTPLDREDLVLDTQVGYPVQLLRNRPDVVAAEYGLVAAFEATNVARSAFYPSLTLSATSGFQSLELDQWLSANSIFANFVGGLAQPLFNRRQIKTQYEVAQAQQEEALLNFRNTLLIAGKEVSDALFAIETARAKMTVKTREYQAYEKAMEYSEELLNYGLANYLEVLTARESALNARMSVSVTRFEERQAVVSLYKALGGGWM